MRMIKLHNPSSSNIIDYPISEHVVGEDGKLIKLDEGGYKTTGRTLTWTLMSGESIKFPFYVADYLKKVYDFLEVVEEEKETEIKPEEKAVPKEGTVTCKICEKQFKGMRGLGLHMSQKHPEVVL